MKTMTRSWCGALMAAGLLAMPGDLEAQSLAGLDEAIEFYHAHATSNLIQILEATRRFELIDARLTDVEDLPDRWLAPYWTSLGYTQLVVFSGDGRGPHYAELARHYHEKAARLAPAGDSVTDADLHALGAQVSSFLLQAYPGEATSHRNEARRRWALAAETDPDNPMVFMNRAVSMIAAPATRERAYEAVDQAIELYEARVGTRRPRWGREFLEVWTGRYPRGGG